MLVKFLARGTGSAQAAADYLLRETDSLGKVRDDVAVLRGDPNAVAAVADSLEFDHKYTSGVIAWAPEDQPSDRDIDRVLDEFEQTAWAGLAPDRYAWTAVRHRTASGGAAGWDRARGRPPRRRTLARDQKSWDAGLGGTKRDGCGTHPGVCWVFSWRRRPTGRDFWLAFSPHSAIFEGGWTGFDPLENRG